MRGTRPPGITDILRGCGTELDDDCGAVVSEWIPVEITESLSTLSSCSLRSSLHSSRLSTPMSQSGEGIRAVMSRKEWFTANIIELGGDPEITS